MKKKAIIHISDLHVMLPTLRNGDPKKVIKSWFNTNSSDETVNNYLNGLINFIKDEYNITEYEFHLIITGDITDEAQEEEFSIAAKIINKIKSELKIKIENLLIVPGDHDINRIDSENAFNADSKKLSSYLYNEKYDKFAFFYEDMFKTKFVKQNIILNHLVVDNVVFVGMNSNFKIDFTGGLGFIDIDKLKEELTNIDLIYKDYSKIAVFHHNISAFFENNVTGQWDKENRVVVLKMLKSFQYKAVLFGNEHTSGSVEEDQFFYIGVGSIGMKYITDKDTLPSFKVYTINEDNNNLTLVQDLFHLINSNKNKSSLFGNWGIQNTVQLGELKEFNLLIKPNLTSSSSVSLLEDELQEDENIKIEEFKEDSKYPYIDYLDNEFHHKIFNRVKELKIFHSGHFHWSDNSKAHNWIEVAKLLNDKEDVLICKKAILDIIDKSEIEFDFIIGLGIEGNILASRTAMVYGDIPYSYLPYSYRYEDHADYEQKLSVENSGFKKVLIITDVVHDGNTIRKLIHEKEPDFFNEVEEIYVISLFYSGKDQYRLDLINITEERKKLEKGKGNLKYEHQPLEERIKFYFVSKMIVETCPYGADFRETCMIVKHKLDCVHEFYDAKK